MKIPNIEKAEFVIEKYRGICTAIDDIEKSDKKMGVTNLPADDRYDSVEINGVYHNRVWVKHSAVMELLTKLREQYKKEVEAL